LQHHDVEKDSGLSEDRRVFANPSRSPG